MKDATFSSARLLALYDRISYAEDAIPRLRRFVLDLAVRGKLVEQDEGDEPAAELLKRIAEEKARQVKAKTIRTPKSHPSIDDTELPCILPRNNWSWARLSDIGRLSGGMTPSMNRHDYWGGEVIWLSPKDIKSDEVSTSELKITEFGLSETRLEAYPIGSLFIVARSGILKRTLPVAINRRPAASNQDLKVLVPYLDDMDRYLQIMLRGFETFILRDLVKTGTTVQSLKYDEFERQPFPLPPLAEQHRIVFKVDELMALCDLLEQARAGREVVRDRLTTASLARLTAPDTDAEAFQSHARFALQSLPTLTTRPDQIKTLRQTILNLAVRGKLVEQDAADEPAADLLKRIVQEKARLVKEGQIRKSKDFKRIDEIPYSLPKTWEWVRLGEIGETQTGSTPPKSHPEFYGSDVPFIRPGDIYPTYVDYSGHGLSHAGAAASGRLAPAGSILMVCIGTIGKSQLIDRTSSFNQQINALTAFSDLAPKFLLRAIQSDFFQAAAWGASAKTTIPILNKGNWEQLAIPIPPVAEQHRIVAKVDAMMALCDQLEASLTTTATTRSKLLNSLLHEALEPATETAHA